MGSFVHVLGHKKDALKFMSEHGIPPFVWHIPGKGFKALRTLYRKEMQSHIDSLIAGEPVLSLTKKDAKANADKAADKRADENFVPQPHSPIKRPKVVTVLATQ